MVDIAQQAAIHPASAKDAAAARVPLTTIDPGQWRALAQRAVEPNGYYLPAWALAVSATARSRTNASALPAFDKTSSRLIGLMPVISLWRACKIPLPALVSAHPYGTLCSPLIDRDAPIEAATQVLQDARKAGAHALVLNDVALEYAAMHALKQALSRDGLKPRILSSYLRASLDATQDDETLLRDALGSKKLKELRRLRHRLEEHGPVAFDVARRPDEIGPALETFLQLEASGWKGKRGTALVQHAGDAAFIRRAVPALAETAQCEIITLRAGTRPVAAGIVLRHQDRAFFFKLGIDERFARYSPGVQLTLELTRHLCADPAIASADSTASADHPMINPIWRGRFAIGDVLIPLRRHDPVVALIHGALVGFNTAHETARRLVRRLRK
ncbi:GNAT family N-acetyltransferase [Bradyrhizobium frederickii]|uniref:GNAT family N-acetyltransferase n=1 Tax=Bradyrhizobium frederickii TaxID=2560054 RepID=A0A4Y9L944_9BRAD|nr:GNAT family N-acetyltransferase [Bradyrhizobium frederickii]TFV39207.1 GNAT family N-acetyltransferase [Bradyrhizobium frederickii]